MGANKIESNLYKAILSLQTEEECERFFEDLCTVKEIDDMKQRFKVAELLKQGLIYNEILEQTGVSSATITRVNKCLRYGSDGYKLVLERIGEK